MDHYFILSVLQMCDVNVWWISPTYLKLKSWVIEQLWEYNVNPNSIATYTISNKVR